MKWVSLSLLLACSAKGAATPVPPKAPPPAGVQVALAEPVKMGVFESATGLAQGWTDLGWAQRTLVKGAPAQFDFSRKAGWIVSHTQLPPRFGALLFRIKGPQEALDALEVHLDATLAGPFPKVPVTKGFKRLGKDGWSEIAIAFADLDPGGTPFEQIVFQPAREIGRSPVQLDDIGLTADASVPVRLVVDCGAPTHPISPLIYGTANGDKGWWESGTSARRWGGNPNSRYNWQIGNAWNTAHDYFFRNTDYGFPAGPMWLQFLEANIEHHTPSAITIPMLGWVAKDTHSYAFPVSRFGPQQAQAGENPDMGNGVDRANKPLEPGPPELTSVPAPPSFEAEWVKQIAAHDSGHNVAMYILDNEPTLWGDTHRDVHPSAVTYDELLDKTIKYASAIRAADPKTPIAGFVGWGYPDLIDSPADNYTKLKMDKLKHGTTNLLDWWLRRVREYEETNGVRLVDILDMHWYPQENNIYAGGNGGTDAESNRIRINSVRSLWDPDYVDGSWIKTNVQLLPRLRKLIEKNAPGMKISIGEYNFGAERHMSGGLAEAEALGRFANEGIHSAFFWSTLPDKSPVYWAFRAYRNFDGKGGRFLDESVSARSEDKRASIFASRAKDGHQVLVLLNTDPNDALRATIELQECRAPTSVQAFTYGGGPNGFEKVEASPPGQKLVQELPSYSITVVDLPAKP